MMLNNLNSTNVQFSPKQTGNDMTTPRSPFTPFQRPPEGLRRFYDRITKEHYLATSRRSIVKAGVAAAGLATVGGIKVAAQTPSGTPATAGTTDDICVLTPEITEGPYYLDDMVLRENITEGKAGLPLELKILVLDAIACTPIENAAVEIWHCDANGFYSGFVENDPGDNIAYVDDGSNPDTFLRGLQLTNNEGVATFQTTYPGWYIGRDIHIHLKVHVDGEADNGSYDGGHVAHTGQLAFSDDITDQVALIEPYSLRSTTFTRLDEDGVFGNVEEDDPTFFVTLSQVSESGLDDGVIGEITLGVDLNAT